MVLQGFIILTFICRLQLRGMFLVVLGVSAQSDIYANFPDGQIATVCPNSVQKLAQLSATMLVYPFYATHGLQKES